MKRLLKVFSLLGFFLALSTGAQAEGFVGIGYGNADYEGTDDSGMKIFGGGKVSPNFGVEVAYYDFGEASETFLGDTFVLSASGIEIAAVGYVQAGPVVEIFGKVGMLMWDVDASIRFGGGGSISASDDGTDIGLGIGANFNVANNFKIRASYEMFSVSPGGADLDIDYLSAAAVFTF